MCNREEYFDDGFNEITESKTNKILKAITVTSNNRKELAPNLGQKVAPKNEASQQGPVIIFAPYCPQEVYRQSYRSNFFPQYQNYQPNCRQYQSNYRQFQSNYCPQQDYVHRPNKYREFRPQVNDPRPSYYNEQPQTRNYWSEPPDSPPFDHQSYVNRPIYRLRTKKPPENLLRQGLLFDSPILAQDRYGIQKAKEFSYALQHKKTRGMNYPFNQKKTNKDIQS